LYIAESQKGFNWHGMWDVNFELRFVQQINSYVFKCPEIATQHVNLVSAFIDSGKRVK
jgi:hypothetical protein